MEQLPPKRTRRTSAEIKQLLEDFKLSGINANEFCKSIGITEGVFYKWRSRYGEKAPPKQNGFVNLQTPSTAGCEPGLFAEVKGIRIYQTVSAQFLKELLA
jgi:hypothetical protein